MLGLTPEIAHDASRYMLLDVRSSTERYCGIGFIPGSLLLPPWLDSRRGVDQLETLCRGKQPVLVCLTAERSRALALSLGEDGAVDHLAGGLRRWAAAGWPIAGTWAAGGPASRHQRGRFPRVLRAELEEMLGEDAAQGVLGESTRVMGISVETCPPGHLHAWLDQVAVELVEHGIPRSRVGHLVDRLLTLLPPPIRGLVRGMDSERPMVEHDRYSSLSMMPRP